jgi:hypothetical protein
MGIVRMLVSSAIVSAEGSLRAGAGLAELAVRRTPPLVVLGTRATVLAGVDGGWAQAAFRDELLTLYDDAADVAWRQLRRARDELGVRTSPALNGAVARLHRVKA